MFAFSCNKDDDKLEDSKLVGKWQLVDIQGITIDSGDTSNIDVDVIESNYYIHFHADGRFDGGELFDFPQSRWNWKNDQQLIIDIASAYQFNFDVKEFTENRMVIHWHYEDTEEEVSTLADYYSQKVQDN